MIYLASQSPRRRELLEQINVSFQLVAVAIDETPLSNESPEDFVIRMALEKARAAWRRDMQKPLLSADTIVIIDGQIIGKPKNKDDFLNIMQSLSARTHQVMTAVAMTSADKAADYRLNVSEVSFRDISSLEAERYWRSREPQDKAGGYAVQGLGALFIREIRGSYSGIMGLPLFETAELLAEFNVNPL